MAYELKKTAMMIDVLTTIFIYFRLIALDVIPHLRYNVAT